MTENNRLFVLCSNSCCPQVEFTTEGGLIIRSHREGEKEYSLEIKLSPMELEQLRFILNTRDVNHAP